MGKLLQENPCKRDRTHAKLGVSKEDNDMSYDKKGLGVAEMTFLSVNYPDIFKEIWDMMDVDETGALEMARKAIKAIELHLVGC